MIEGAAILSQHFPGQEARHFPPMRIGPTPEARDLGTDLILLGHKTATASLPWEWAHAPRPFVGALCVLYDGADRAMAILETTGVFDATLADLPLAFVKAYGETDGTMAGFRRDMVPHLATKSADAGEPFGPDSRLICEYFRVIRRLPVA